MLRDGVQRDAKGHLSKQGNAIQPRLSFPVPCCVVALRIIMSKHCLIGWWPGHGKKSLGINSSSVAQVPAVCLNNALQISIGSLTKLEDFILFRAA